MARIRRKTNGNIEILDNGKWWLVDYIAFQHGDFSIDSENKAHKSYIALLKKHGLLDRVMETLSRPNEDPKEGSSKIPKARVRDKDKEKAREYEERFNEFYSLYPRKEDKKKARERFLALKPDEKLFSEIMVGLKAHINSKQWQKEGGQYIPLPSTFLNRRRWEDEIECEPETSNPFE